MDVAQAVLPSAGMSGFFSTLGDWGVPITWLLADRNSLLVPPLANPFPKSFM